MGQTLTNGIYLPDEGEVRCYAGLASNWTTLDVVVGGYRAHVANENIHITSAERNKWDNGVTQAYVLRYANTSLTALGTVAFSALDNTDNVKIGDKVLDSEGKLFALTAVDTANSTATLSALLIDLSKDSDLSNYYTKPETDTLLSGKANDSDVVHKSRNETVGGQKTFSDDLLIYNSDNSVDTPRLNIKTSKYVKGDTTNTDTMRINFLDSNGNNVASVYANKNTGGSQYLAFQVYTTDNNNANITSTINYYISKSGDKSFVPYEDNQISLGGSVRHWKSVYATNYYYGANNEEFSTKFVTTDTAQTISGTKTFTDNNMIKTSSPKVLLINTSQTGNTPPSSNTASFLRFDGGTVNSFGGVQCEFLTTGENRLTNYVNDITKAKLNTIQQRASSTTAMTMFNADLLAPANDGVTALGSSSKRWSDVQTYKINALEPSSLSLPSGNVNDVIDISSYLVYLDGTANTYTAPANGWISITMNGCSGIQAYINGLWGNQIVRPSVGAVRFLMPVVKNLTVNILIFGGAIDNARFIPCQGNV